jgi:hypothetical protein
LLAIETEGQAVSAADAFKDQPDFTRGVEAIKSTQTILRGHHPTKDPTGRISNYVIEPRLPLVGYVIDQRNHSTLAPNLHRTLGHEEQERTVSLYGEATDNFALIKLFVLSAAGVEAEHPASGNVAPIETLFKRMPERVLTNFAAVIAN